jgi:hypothetical protein
VPETEGHLRFSSTYKAGKSPYDLFCAGATLNIPIKKNVYVHGALSRSKNHNILPISLQSMFANFDLFLAPLFEE